MEEIGCGDASVVYVDKSCQCDFPRNYDHVIDVIKSNVYKYKEEIIKATKPAIEGTCSSCRMSPIYGSKFQCLTCSNFTLCEICEELGHEHPMMKIKSKK